MGDRVYLPASSRKTNVARIQNVRIAAVTGKRPSVLCLVPYFEGALQPDTSIPILVGSAPRILLV